MPRKKEQTFEEALTKLEELVTNMENGDASLSELLKNYSEGIELADKCTKDLNRAEKTIDLLINRDGGQVNVTELKIEGE